MSRALGRANIAFGNSMRVFAVWSSLATIVTLNVVIGMGLFNVGDTPIYGRMLGVLHAVLPISSVVMMIVLVKDRQWVGAAVFAAVIAGMSVVATLRLTGPEFSRHLHLLLDLAALNAYVAVVPAYRSTLARERRLTT